MTEFNLTLDPRIIDSPTALRILDVAGHLFMQRGYRAVSINDIINAAGVTKPTLYYYFSDKEELFVQMGLRVLITMSEPLAELVSADLPLVERLRAIATLLINGYEGDMRVMRHEMMEHLGEAARARLSAAFYQHLFEPLIRLMREAGAAGLIRNDLAPTMLATLFLSLCETFHELTPTNPFTRWVGEVSPALLVDLFLNGAGRRATPNPLTGAA
ncbi:TetR/AcrR family transcriptional regulator [Chloroflexus sp.]|uniref:TetR/AcrR family transcriptional regulator n=1 Tax=Chloroflexus sp. TaxID=1904827 RepID=UPI00260CC09D|nr:TetR/AcrR family transcriptional regulator [uncultured Chloroflexus sp.]